MTLKAFLLVFVPWVIPLIFVSALWCHKGSGQTDKWTGIFFFTWAVCLIGAAITASLIPL